MCFSALPYAKIQNFASDCKTFSDFFMTDMAGNVFQAQNRKQRRRRKQVFVTSRKDGDGDGIKNHLEEKAATMAEIKNILRKNDGDGGDVFNFFLSSSFFSLVLVLCS